VFLSTCNRVEVLISTNRLEEAKESIKELWQQRGEVDPPTLQLVVANRTLSRAVELARSLGGSAISLEEIEEALVGADIVISSTGAPGIILRKDQVKRIMRPRRHRLLFIIDIAVPRDIDPEINDIDNVYLYDIDDLKGVIEFNKAEREKEASKADRIVEAEVIKFMSWMESLNVVPVIQHLQEKAEAVRQKELSRSRKVLVESLNDEQQKALDVLTRIVCLKKGTQEKDGEMILDAARLLFGIDSLEDTQRIQAFLTPTRIKLYGNRP